MALKVIGAGLGRTGTNSLKLAIERLLGGPCYHMFEVVSNPHHVPMWHAATREEMPDWSVLFDGFQAAVDWPVAAFWRELMTAFPDAIVLLSVRDTESWWTSAHDTIFRFFSNTADAPGATPELRAMLQDLFRTRFTLEVENKAACIALFEAHNAEVRRSVPASRLVEWRPGDGWAPLCRALGLPVPAEPFPHVNTTEEIRARLPAAQNGAGAATANR